MRKPELGKPSYFPTRVESESFGKGFEWSQVEPRQDIFANFLFSVYSPKERWQQVFHQTTFFLVFYVRKKNSTTWNKMKQLRTIDFLTTQEL
jgi:hypothetical protein